MPDGFEVFQRSRVTRLSSARIKTPAVTIGAQGMMSFSAAAFEMLGEPQYVFLLYSNDKRFVGFRGTSLREADAYLMRSHPKHPTFHKVSGRTFCREMGIDTHVTRRYDLRMVDGIARIDLEKPLPSLW